MTLVYSYGLLKNSAPKGGRGQLIEVNHYCGGVRRDDNGVLLYTPTASPAWKAAHPTNDASRGTTIITQKENKGEYRGMDCWEYNSCVRLNANADTWIWQESDSNDIYAHVFDQNGPYDGIGDNIPIRYLDNTKLDWSGGIPQCASDYDGPDVLLEKSKGLYGNNYEKIIKDQYACKSNTHNAGNYYNFPAATAGSKTDSGISYPYNTKNSICPKGWQLPENSESSNKSYNNLIRNAYQITDGPSSSIDVNLLANSAMSFMRLGDYLYAYGAINNRSGGGIYWSSTTYSSVIGYDLSFASEYLNPQDGNNKAYGFSIRCVSR